MNNVASELHWIPDSLYNYTLTAVAANYNSLMNEIKMFPGNMLFDVYYQLYKEGHLKKLSLEFSNIDIFRRLLKIKDKRYLLHNCFQAIMDHGCPIAEELAQAFEGLCFSACNLPASSIVDLISIGFSIGNFLVDSGWFLESESIFKACLLLCNSLPPNYILKVTLQCYSRLLHVQNINCKFEEAKKTLLKSNECILDIRNNELECNLASVYGEFSAYYFSVGDYKEAYRWAIDSLNELEPCLFPKDVIQVLCHTSKACVLKREFKRSEMLIKQALHMAKENYGCQSLVYASVLLDYGYYLLSVDLMHESLKVYQSALSLHTRVFGGNNLLVAKCHECLAYSSYILEYNSGQFKDALDHADKSLSIMHNLAIEDSFLLIYAKKAKALILEEMAIDLNDASVQKKYFSEAKELHYYGLNHVYKAFGELNLHAAKFLGNIGRLYQSMQEYKKAQNMMLKAIAIREALLEPDDHEIAMSVSHLASLYTFDMELHEEAEALFLKSIAIGKKLFGDGYSGLSYDYKGLLRVYSCLGDTVKLRRYQRIFHNWKEIRKRTEGTKPDFSPLNIELDPIPLEDIMTQFVAVQ